jgi:RecA-family ATPase
MAWMVVMVSQVYIYPKLNKVHMLNIHSFLYVNHTSKKSSHNKKQEQMEEQEQVNSPASWLKVLV